MSTNSMENEIEKNDKMNDSDLEIPMDYSIKHPLQNTWTLWYFENDRSQSWTQNQKEIASFNTVEDFWSLYNHIRPASDLRQGSDYSLFKQGIKPMWEDPINKHGGRWLISLDRKQRNDLDRYWLDILLCLIGETFENAADVCGAVANVRQKGDKIGIWTSNYENKEAILEIGRKLKERLRIPSKTLLLYQAHIHTMDKSSSANNNASRNSYTYTV